MASHRVLTPLDGSDPSRQILKAVRTFLPPAENELILLRVGAPPEGFIGHPGRVVTPDFDTTMYESVQDLKAAKHPIYASQERDSAEAEMRREVQHDVRELEDCGYRVQVCVRFGRAGEEIVDCAENLGVDLVAMSTHSRGINRLIFGSVTEYVAKHVSIPMLIMHPDNEE